MDRKIVILGTGGTIAGTAATPGDNLGYTAAQVGVDELVRAVPPLARLPIVTEQVAQLDSKDMSHAVWRALAARVGHWLADDAVQGIVVTHGTDTLEETAWFLQAALQPAKPVVLTCAMRPATALAPDGPQNVLDAVAAAQAGGQGVMVACAGVLHDAANVQKLHTYRLDAFGSGEAGPLGYIEEGVVRLMRPWPAVGRARAALLALDAAAWPRVEIVLNHAGASGRMVELAVADGVQGLVAAGTGNGTLNAQLQQALEKAQAGGVRVLRATRCALGRVYASPTQVLPDSDGLTPVKARIALMMAIAEGSA